MINSDEVKVWNRVGPPQVFTQVKRATYIVLLCRSGMHLVEDERFDEGLDGRFLERGMDWWWWKLFLTFALKMSDLVGNEL